MDQLEVAGLHPQVEECVDKLRQHGVVILPSVVGHDALIDLRRSLGGLITAIEGHWRPAEDDVYLDLDDLGVVRMPECGRLRKNVHLSDESPQHEAMAEFMQTAGIPDILQAALGSERTLVLSETGLSLTLPGGSEIEWHADGDAGEFTVLMSLDTFDRSTGPLGIRLGSHLDYVTDHRADEAAGRKEKEEREEVWYCYREGVPCVIDARTQHMGSANQYSSLRVVCWWIYQSVES
ncbi:unnamed protein product [Vitrella brassicaformis CCMP3155]|uniref:Uncharacterized protein n=1 Tax=Vitrella brassicaformis (strain CCMP3155) TaxID=1169540 RepID=A0A0G4ENP2_VITBC|nr:unnamed protein product [Vitrella brassicaformis CCMP3155]|eukprot:CEL98577.1 unnamed protein product [Vitrella brassicaformis CCMP3155]